MSAGVIGLTNNKTGVVGSGTSFTSDLKSGDFIVAVVGGVTYTLPVANVENNTTAWLVSPYTGPTTSNLSWYAVPRLAMNLVTAALVAQSAEALRGLNYDKQNWQSIFSGTGTVTVKLPDGSSYSGPAWGGITETLNLKADKTSLDEKADKASLGTAAGKNTGTTTSDVMQPGMFGIGRPDGVFRFNVTSIDAILSGIAGYGLSVLRNDNQIPEPWYVHNYSPALFMRAGDTYTLWCAPFENFGPIRVFGGADGRGWMTARRILDDVTTTTDSNGFIKKASPVIQLYGDGRFEVNAESEGCTVVRQGRGVYLIDGCTGLNADASWGGTDGGFEIPVDRNKQPRIWLDYKVNADGSVLVRTYHRVHPSAPEFAQNRIGNTDINGVFTETVADGEPVDIPADSFVSVRVEMPENSIWNQKKKETREAMEKAEREREQNQQDTHP
ncbi:phage tail protein [Salmonella enterica]|nr:phage tail protein [Salmonella enterica]EKS7256919.1 phage tail protein [Salmonella enterica]EKS7283883.1 phage tail protein [Salmonella enterica]EKS7292871.1 phage tail protein [Salmonella enterica]EKS7312336.1 phage tail protein [Salmonella enterica]